MALHTALPIYKVAYDLLNLSATFVKNMPRSIKPVIGQRVCALTLEIVVLISRANAARDKRPHLQVLLERLVELEILLRLCQDNRYISRDQYAQAIDMTSSVGKQANGWMGKQHAASPVV